MCWGPYALVSFYAIVENAALVSPKLRMVRVTLQFAPLFLTNVFSTLTLLLLHLPLQMAPIMAKTAPTLDVFLYVLGNENYRGGIWQLLTGEKIEAPQIENKSK